MFKKVKTSQELTLFNQILMTNWLEKGYDLEIADGSTELFLFSEDGVNWCATLEIKSFEIEFYRELQFGLQEDRLPKKKDHHPLLEIDKFSILKKNRGSLTILSEIMGLVISYGLQRHAAGIVALIEPRFYRAISSRLFKLPTLELAKPFMYKGDMVQPMVIPNTGKDTFEALKWYKSFQLQHA